MSLDFNEQNVKTQLQVGFLTVLVTVTSYLYGRLIDRLLGNQPPVFAIVQLGLFGIFSGYLPVLLRNFGYSDDVISKGMIAYGASALLGQPQLLQRFASLVPTVV